jgi:hypothetical protein
MKTWQGRTYILIRIQFLLVEALSLQVLEDL